MKEHNKTKVHWKKSVDEEEVWRVPSPSFMLPVCLSLLELCPVWKLLPAAASIFFFFLLLSYGRYVGWGEGPKDTHQGGTKPETYDNRKLGLTCLLNIWGWNSEWLNYFGM